MTSEGIIEKVLFCSIWWWTHFKNFEIGIYSFGFCIQTLHIYFFQKDFDMDVKEAHFISPLYQHLEKGV